MRTLSNVYARPMTHTATLTARPVYSAYTGPQDPGAIEFSIKGDTREAVDAIVALFPKSAKIRPAGPCDGTLPDGSNGTLYYLSRTSILFATNGVNKGVNETGVRRYQAVLRAAAKAGIEVTVGTEYGNSYASLADLDAALTGQAARVSA